MSSLALETKAVERAMGVLAFGHIKVRNFDIQVTVESSAWQVILELG